MKIGRIVEVLLFYYKIKFKRVKNNKNILIYGISRGGTTMLAETLVKLFNTRLVWEPLFPHREVFLKRINPFSTHRYNELKLGWNPHISKKNNPQINNYFNSLFKLQERNIRFYRFSNHESFSTQNTTIFKFCFANFMYPYFNQNFNFKSIVLLRHPFAIAASSLNFGANYDWHKKNYDKWKYPISELDGGIFEQFNKKSNLITSAFTLLVFQAVTKFSFILKNLNKENTIVVYYEDLIVEKEKVCLDLEIFFQEKIDLEIFKATLSKQSFSSKVGHTNSDAMSQLSKWKEKCSDKDIADGLRIFEAFDFFEYSDEILPLK